ncbi:14589_t:CDS:2, partial [Dentiscutata erythropus]
EFDRKRFYIEMKKEGNRSNTGICPSKWRVIAEIHKEIFPESDTKPFTQNQTSQIIIQKSNKKNRDYITQEEADKWKELGLGECLKTENLNDCLTLCHDLEQYDLEA